MLSLRSWMVIGITLVPLTMVSAQEKIRRRNANREDQNRTDTKTTAHVGKTSGQLDAYFVSCLKEDNNGEITIAKLATQKAMNPEVKAFAQEMIKDHTDFLAKLSRFEQASPAAATESVSETTTEKTRIDRDRADNKADNVANPPKPRQETRPEANRDGNRDATRTDVTTQTTVRGSNDIANQLMQVKKEIADKCVASAQKALNEKEGKEFDHCYMAMQVGAHMHMVDTLSVLNSHTSSELQQVIDEGLQTAQQHLEHAKQIAKKLEGASVTAGEERATEKVGARKSDRNKTE